jgi:hypothetical protein
MSLAARTGDAPLKAKWALFACLAALILPTAAWAQNSGSRSGSSGLSDETEMPVRGLSSYYWRGSFGYQYNSLSKNDPGNTNTPIADERHKMLLSGTLGWGPIRADDLYFNIHYSYIQDWKTDTAQAQTFFSKWFSDPKAESFLFRTQDLLRLHELASDLRYVSDPLQAGVFTRFTIGRVGSQILGDSFEEARTVVKSENFVPYVSYKYGRVYRTQLAFPMRTEINEEQPILSNASYAFSSSGRGPLISAIWNNGFFIPVINSLVFFDGFYLRYKYASIQNDRDQLGMAASIDFPVIWRIRAAPRLVFYQQDFVADRVRIACFRKAATSNEECPEDPTLVKRKDSFLGSGGQVYFDYTPNSRFVGDFKFNRTSSTIPEFNSVEYLFTLSYVYSWPKTTTVQKRTQRFQENKYAEEF